MRRRGDQTRRKTAESRRGGIEIALGRTVGKAREVGGREARGNRKRAERRTRKTTEHFVNKLETVRTMREP